MFIPLPELPKKEQFEMGEAEFVALLATHLHATGYLTMDTCVKKARMILKLSRETK